MENLYRIKYASEPYGEVGCETTTDKHYAKSLAIKTLGRIEMLVHGKWVFLGEYDYANEENDFWKGKNPKDFKRKWVPARNA